MTNETEHQCGGPQEACCTPGCTECGMPFPTEKVKIKCNLCQGKSDLNALTKPYGLFCSRCHGTGYVKNPFTLGRGHNEV